MDMVLWQKDGGEQHNGDSLEQEEAETQDHVESSPSRMKMPLTTPIMRKRGTEEKSKQGEGPGCIFQMECFILLLRSKHQ